MTFSPFWLSFGDRINLAELSGQGKDKNEVFAEQIEAKTVKMRHVRLLSEMSVGAVAQLILRQGDLSLRVGLRWTYMGEDSGAS